MPSHPRVALLYPPLIDPTSGYHSLSYLDSYARAQGHPPADLIDTSIEAFHFSYSPAGVEWLQECLRDRPHNRYAPYLSEEAVQAQLLQVAEPDPAAVRSAVAVLQDPDLFYDYDRYQQAVNDISSWMNCLGALGFPGQFRNGFEVTLPPVFTIGSSAALTDFAALALLSRPFQRYYDDILLPRLRSGNYDVIGMNVTYEWQLPFALWLSHLIRERVPGTFLIAGGTEVSDVWKYALDKTTAYEVFDDFDAFVVGEGESAYVCLLEAVAAGTPPAGHPNIRLHRKYGPRPLIGRVHYERLQELPVPDYSGLDWKLYLSPERFVYYSPTRGCYWNKCTFCDYGLNTDGPTSPWRQDQVETMMRDVTAIAAFSKFIYFSVDVLAPATILKFAQRVVDAGLDIRWGAEIRLEKYWSVERAELLRRSGCVAISVGFESGNQRVLDLIDKGTRLPQVKQTISAMHSAGIGVQMMGFTGFPTETAAEARDSVDFLVDNRELWTFGGLGEFQLTSGAIVAKEPERFGVSDVRPISGSDIACSLLFTEPISQLVRDEVAVDRRRIRPGGHYGRPWLGGTDTPHSFFFHDRFGTEVTAVLDAARSTQAVEAGQLFILNGEVIATPPTRVQQAYADGHSGAGRIGENRLTFRRADGNVTFLQQQLKPLLELFREPVTLTQASARAWMLDEVSATRVWRSLFRQGLIRLVPTPVAGQPIDLACSA